MPRQSAHARLLAVILALSLAIPGILLAAPAQSRGSAPVVPQPRGFNVFSQQQDVQLGEQYSQEVSKQMPVLQENDPLTRYVQQIGQRLGAQLPQNPYKYTFHVVQEKDINAFALPGGPVYVNLGAIRAADNEAELAGVIAHEMSHVYMRHSTRQASKQVLAQVPLAVLGGMIGGGVMGQLAQLGIGFGLNSVFLKYSRDAESEADSVGAVLMYKAGYNPKAMADFFQKLEGEGGARGPQFLSDHPDPGNREEAIRKQVAGYPPENYLGNSADFARIKADADKTKAYTAEEIANQSQSGQPTQGISRPADRDIKPSQTLTTFNHNAYRIQYPQNWQLMGDATSSVTIAPKGSVSDSAVAYGVMINAYQPENSQSLDQATHELLTQLRQSNPEMREVGQDETIRVNGIDAKSVQMIGVSPIQGSNGKNLREREWLVALPDQGNQILYLVFIAPEPDYSQLQPTFERMLRSLHLQ
jgi:Zn-dependent protease with chaperone function